MAQFVDHYVQDLHKPLEIRQGGNIVFNADDESNVVSVDLYEGETEYSGGGTVAGAVICPDGATVALVGSMDGNTASVTLTADCFAIPGQIGVGIQVISGATKTTVLKAIYNVELFDTDTVIDPGSRIATDVSALVQAIEDAIADIPSNLTDLKAAIAPTFSNTLPYSIGQYVWYDGKLYKFKANHPAGTWSSSHVALVAEGDDLFTAKTALYYESLLSNAGTYTVGADLFEQGQWGYGSKVTTNYNYRIRNKALLPVTAGTVITYTNTDQEIYIGIVSHEEAGTYLQNTSTWMAPLSTPAERTFTCNYDGYLVLMCRYDASTTQITPSDFDSTITIKTSVTSLVTNIIITTDDIATTMFGKDLNNLLPNKVYCIGAQGLTISNVPYSGFMGTVMCFHLKLLSDPLAGAVQIAISNGNRLFTRINFTSQSVWGNWKEFVPTSDLEGLTSLVTNTMVTTYETAETMFSADLNNLQLNKVYCIGKRFLNISNMPYDGFMGSVLCFHFKEISPLAGAMQIAISYDNRVFTRINWGNSSTWGAWKEVSQEVVYNVGPTRANTSLVALLQTIQTDETPKIIYIDEGEYDIFQEYRDNNVLSPTSDTELNKYHLYNPLLPRNTKLIGIGNVVLKWQPESSDITELESKVWSPLNLYAGNNTVENITILCKNGRYCIHDDGPGTFAEFTNKYKNVRCIYTQSDEGLGYNNVTGFGFEDRCVFEFDDCLFQYINTGGTANHGVFYGHEGSTGGASIFVRNCVLLGGSDNNARTIRLQSIHSDDSNRILTQFSGCYIQGGIHLTEYNSSGTQYFDVTLLHSGDPTQTIDISNNPYPIKVYQ